MRFSSLLKLSGKFARNLHAIAFIYRGKFARNLHALF